MSLPGVGVRVIRRGPDRVNLVVVRMVARDPFRPAVDDDRDRIADHVNETAGRVVSQIGDTRCRAVG